LARRWRWILGLLLLVALVVAAVRYLDYRTNLTAEHDVRAYLRAHQLAAEVRVHRCRHSPDPERSIDNEYWCDLTSRRAVVFDDHELAIPQGHSIVCFVVPDADRCFGSPSLGAYPDSTVQERNCFSYS